MPPEVIVKLIKNGFQEFIGTLQVNDDITILIMQSEQATNNKGG